MSKLKNENEMSVEIFVYPDRCVYLNDMRVTGKKVYPSEKIKPLIFKAKLSHVLNAFSKEEIESYLKTLD